jgi:Tol biopolymer transport system component
MVTGLVAIGLGLAAAIAWMGRPEPQEPVRPTPWTSLEGSERDPAFSPDGDQLAFVWNGGGDGFFHLYVKLVSGGDMLQLTDSPANDRYPVWSPDGREIAFARKTKMGYQVRVVPALGGPERRFTESTASPKGLDWSPDGRFIAIADQSPGVAQTAIVLLDVREGDKTALTTPPPKGEGDGFPNFSPDGKIIAFIRRDVNVAFSKIFTRAIEPAEESRLLDFDAGRSIDLDWLPDGSGLLVAAARDGYTNLWKVPTDGKTATKLVVGEGVRTLSVDHTGTRLAYAEARSPVANIWRIARSGDEAFEEPACLIASTRFDWDPEISPDGKKIVLASWRSGGSGVWICDAGDIDCTPVTQEGRAFNPTWSPDGNWIAYTGEIGGNVDVYVTDVEGAFHRRLTQSESADGFPSFSHDGQWIFFTSDRRGESENWKIPIEGGEAIPLSQGRQPRESVDGRYLYYAKEVRGFKLLDLFRRPMEGGDEELVLERKTGGHNWDLRNGEIIFTHPSEHKGITIQRLDLDTLDLTTIAELGDELMTSNGLDVSPDGRSILFAVQEPQTTDIVLVEGFH